MLHSKFQDHRTLGSGGEDFIGFGQIWTWQYLGYVTKTTKFMFPLP